MPETDKNNELQNILNQVKVGQMVSIVTTESSMVAGVVLAIIEYMDEEQCVQKNYRIRLGVNHSIDIPSDAICYVKICADYSYKEYLQEFETKYGVVCFDEDERIKPVPTIIDDILVRGVWDRLEDEERVKLIECLSMNYDCIVDLINALSKSRKRNNELHEEVCDLIDKRTAALKQLVDFTNEYNDIINIFPQYRWALECVFEWFGIGKLLEAI